MKAQNNIIKKVRKVKRLAGALDQTAANVAAGVTPLSAGIPLAVSIHRHVDRLRKELAAFRAANPRVFILDTPATVLRDTPENTLRSLVALKRTEV